MLYTALCLFVKCDTCNSYGNKIDLIWFDLKNHRVSLLANDDD